MMRKLFPLALFLAPLIASAQTKPAIPHTQVGDLRLHEHFKSKFLTGDRTLRVLLPPGYDANSDQRYPVLYMHDGQHLFDKAISPTHMEWQVDETVLSLIQQKKLPPIVVVGIDYRDFNERLNDYSPTREARLNAGGNAKNYAQFVVEEVKPFIDKTYRTKTDKESNAIAGSSLGALVSLYIVREYPNVFGCCGAMSTSLWWDNAHFLRETLKDGHWAPGHKIWLDIGTKEGSPHDAPVYVQLMREMKKALLAAGMQDGNDLIALEIPGAEHIEYAWAKRIEAMVEFFFPVPK